MKVDPPGVSTSKRNQGTTQGKEKKYFDFGENRTHDLQIRSTVTLSIELRNRKEKVGKSRRSESKSTCECCAT